MREMLALLRAQWLTALTYRLRLLISVAGVLVGVVPVFLVSQELQPVVGHVLVNEGAQLFGFLVVGTVAMLLISTAMSTLGSSIGSAISTGTWEAQLATPARVWGLVGGLAVYELLWTLAKAAVLLVVAWLLGASIAWSGLALAVGVLLLIVLAYLPIGVLVGAAVLAFRTRTPLPQVVLLASVFLGGVYYPTRVIPGWLQDVSAWIPLTYGLRALRRALLEGWTFAQILPDLEMLVLFVTVLLMVSVAAFAWALGHARRSGTLTQY